MMTSEILDVSLRTYRNLGWTFLKAGALPTLFCLAATLFLTQVVLPGFFTTRDADSLATQMLDSGTSVALGLLVAGPLFLIGFGITTSVVTSLVSDSMVGNLPSLEAAQRNARRTLSAVLRLTFREMLFASSGLLLSVALLMGSALLDRITSENNVLSGLTAGLGLLGISAGGLVFLFVVSRHALAGPALILENLKPAAAARRSHDLLKGEGWHPSGYGTIWAVYLILAFLILALGAGVSLSFSLIGLSGWLESALRNVPYSTVFLTGVSFIPTFLVLWLTIPVWATTMTITYFERRIRKEGYDIEALASEVWRADRTSRFQL